MPKTGPHHHGELETVLYVIKDGCKCDGGNQLKLSGESRAGDFIYLPPYVPHQEINASPNEICEAVVVRKDRIRLWSIWMCTPQNRPVPGIAVCRFTLCAECSPAWMEVAPHRRTRILRGSESYAADGEDAATSVGSVN